MAALMSCAAEWDSSPLSGCPLSGKVLPHMTSPLHERMSSSVYRIGVLTVFVIAALLAVSSAVQDSQTHDEAVHLSAGYSYWKTGDFRLSPEHPPLSKLLVAFPLLLLNPDFTP